MAGESHCPVFRVTRRLYKYLLIVPLISGVLYIGAYYNQHWPTKLPSPAPTREHTPSQPHNDRQEDDNISYKPRGLSTLTLFNGTRPTTDKILILSWPATLHTEHFQSAFTQCDRDTRGRCEFTDDPARLAESEAVLIGLLESQGKLPPYRYPYQKWIFRAHEPPPIVWDHLEEHYMRLSDDLGTVGRVFNLTSTRNPDSDFMTGPISKVCELDSALYDKLVRDDVNYAAGKNDRVAWFVSHCDTQSRREDYARELHKYITVDIYGRCGNLTCGQRGHMGDCDTSLLHEHYKFYLSFENSICDDYVTEKLTRITDHAISTIPIVLGGVDYSKLLPNQTYINVLDYDSPRALADFLKRINQDDQLFNEYIRRKLSLKCESYPELAAYPCRVCSFLHKHRDDVIRAPDVTSVFGVEARCQKPETLLRGVTFPPR